MPDSDSSPLDEVRDRLHRAETEFADELERLIEENGRRFRYTVRAGRVRFEEGMRALHRRYRKGVLNYVRNAPLGFILSAPLIYSLLLPLALLDLFVTVYQQVCFRIYGIGVVKRSDYIVIDRHVLGYLNFIEKLNCVYCGYANGLIGYCREVAARTEQYWCPIKHARRIVGTHSRYPLFRDYADAMDYHQHLEQLRKALAEQSE